MKRSPAFQIELNKLLLIALFITGFLLWIAEAQENPRFLYKPAYGNGYIWEWRESDGLTDVNAMCWSETEGFECDERFTGGRNIGLLIDFEYQRQGNFYEQENGLCYFWWWKPEHDEGGNPHVDAAYWVSCPND